MRTGALHLIALLKKMYENTTACIRGTEAKFDILIGSRQGIKHSQLDGELNWTTIYHIFAGI